MSEWAYPKLRSEDDMEPGPDLGSDGAEVLTCVGKPTVPKLHLSFVTYNLGEGCVS